ncbi:DUF1918 domain-containing protein [Catenulispora subtropica]|uniref:DUF1918 domain-containing protein n=1 Tax=Catenulispora subtropica TaxID=450798 RepID=A0ABP5ES63_9ACTN
MKAAVGDRIAILSRHLDETVREGEIVEVHGAGGDPPYVVHWLDSGHTGVLFPGPDARVRPGEHDRVGGIGGGRAKQWQVSVAVVEYDTGETKAHVIAHTGQRVLQSHGRARRLVGDTDAPEIGDEVAVGRAFLALGEELLDQAARDVEDVEGHRTVVRRSEDGSAG